MHIANDNDLGDLSEKLADAIDYIKNNQLPIKHNIKLAEDMFSSPRELNQYLEILI